MHCGRMTGVLILPAVASARRRCELYGSAPISSDNAAGGTNGAATSLLSPVGGIGGGASRRSPGLFACPYCGSEEASFDGLQVRENHHGAGVSHDAQHVLKACVSSPRRVTLRWLAATKARQMALLGSRTSLEDAREGGKLHRGLTATSPRHWPVSMEIRHSDNEERLVTGTLKWQKH